MKAPEPTPAARRPGFDWLAGPHPCCVEYATVAACDGRTCMLRCSVCQATFQQPCPDADLAAIAAGQAS
jgi:hypothetical protein